MTKKQEQKLIEFQNVLGEIHRESKKPLEQEKIFEINNLIDRLLWGCK